MQQIHRFMIGIPLAFGVTFGLGELMIGLIRVEHISLAERAQKLGFDINPKIEEVKIIHERLKPRPLKPVEPPPAPPVIEHESPALPDETFKNTPTPIPETGPIDLDMGKIRVVVADTDETPILRFPPAMPASATRSGHCVVRFDVGADGVPFHIRTTYCTQSIFARPTIRSVARWKYRPKIRNGQAVIRRGLETVVRFHLLDARGQLIPEQGI